VAVRRPLAEGGRRRSRVSSGSLRSWVKQSAIDAGEREGLTSDERAKRELRRELRVPR
jgi:hypothetical protein